MNELHLPWLELCILVPALASPWVGRILDVSRARSASLVVAATTLLLALAGWIDFETLFAFYFLVILRWFSSDLKRQPRSD